MFSEHSITGLQGVRRLVLYLNELKSSRVQMERHAARQLPAQALEAWTAP